jgi:hypothetical protein
MRLVDPRPFPTRECPILDRESAPPSKPFAKQSDRWVPVLLLLVVLFGLAIRVRQLVAGPSYWYDEAYLLLNIYEKDCPELLGPLRAEQVIPPLFLWLLRGVYVTLGGSEWVMRLPATVFSASALLLIYFMAVPVVGRRGALLATAFCSISNHAMVHSNEVHPYGSDFFMTVLITFVAVAVLTSPGGGSARTVCRIGLLSLAVFAPWLSFPSVLVLGGVSLALLCESTWCGSRCGRTYWVVFSGLLLASSLSLWWVQSRHLYYKGLQETWIELGGFPADHSPGTVLRWSARCFIGLGEYGTTSLGVPLALLGLVGLASCWRRSAPVALLLCGPILLGWLMALLGRYPMADRTLFYAVPCLWLLAILGLQSLARYAGTRSVGVGLVVAIILLTPGALRAAKHLVVVSPKVDFRSAFAYVDRHRQETDLCWVSHPEVFEVYYLASRSCLGSYTPLQEVAERSKGRRLWVVAPPLVTWKGPYDQELLCFFRSLGLRPSSRERFTGLEVLLLEPAADGGGPSG